MFLQNRTTFNSTRRQEAKYIIKHWLWTKDTTPSEKQTQDGFAAKKNKDETMKHFDVFYRRSGITITKLNKRTGEHISQR